MQHRSTSAVARKIAKFIKWKNASATELSHFIYVFIYFPNTVRSRFEMETGGLARHTLIGRLAYSIFNICSVTYAALSF